MEVHSGIKQKHGEMGDLLGQKEWTFLNPLTRWSRKHRETMLKHKTCIQIWRQERRKKNYGPFGAPLTPSEKFEDLHPVSVPRRNKNHKMYDMLSTDGVSSSRPQRAFNERRSGAEHSLLATSETSTNRSSRVYDISLNIHSHQNGTRYCCTPMPDPGDIEFSWILFVFGLNGYLIQILILHCWMQTTWPSSAWSDGHTQHGALNSRK